MIDGARKVNQILSLIVNIYLVKPDRMPLSAIDLAGLGPTEGVIRMPWCEEHRKAPGREKTVRTV